MNTLYLFIDESGNFDFSQNGTKFFVLTVMSATTPFEIGSPLLKLRYDLLPNYACGPRMEEHGYFHASEDIQQVRNNVFSLLSQLNHPLRVDSVIAQKNKTNPTLHKQPLEFYKIIAEALLKYAFNRAIWHDYDHVVVVFSSLFDRKKRGILKQAFKYLIKQHAKVSFALYFHDSKFDICNQAADYFGWAIYRKWDSNDTRSYALVQHLIKSEFDIFEKGGKEFYDYKK
ncbi:MAG: DUF3800 domain-containing protein [Nitrospinae bacterium]|nr:DUF3800 domain-containing protein [Nitrospinota bacterium]